MAQIGIIGAGISGLTLAFLLREKGHEVQVFEATDQPGGAMKTTIARNGWLAEWGPNTIIESSGRIKRLISRLDLQDKRLYTDEHAKKRYIVRDRRPVVVPESLYGLIQTPLLSRRAKWNLLREPFLRKRGESIENRSGIAGKNNIGPAQQMNPGNEESVADFVRRRPGDEESVAGFVRRRLGDEFLKWPVDALVGGIYAGDPELLSVRHAFPRLALLEEQHGSLLWGQFKGGVRRPAGSDEIPRNKARVFSFDEGLQVLPSKLAEQLGQAITYNANVLSVDRISPDDPAGNKTGINTNPGTGSMSTGNEGKVSKESKIDNAGKIADAGSASGSASGPARWMVTYGTPQKLQKSFDVLIYAGTAYGISNIGFSEELTSNLSPLTEIPHPPVASLTLGFRRDDISHPLNGFGVLVPGVEQLPILGTLFSSSLFPGRAPDSDHVTLTTYLGGMRQPEMAEKNEDEQVRIVCETLSKLLGLTGAPQFQHCTLWPKAIPQYHLDHQRYLDVMNKVEQIHSGFYLAGNYRTGISVGDTINAAYDLTERIHSNLEQMPENNRMNF